MDTSVLIIIICVAIPALIALSVCGIIFYSRRNKNRKFHRQTILGTPHEDHPSDERLPPSNHIINFPRASRYQQQRRLREPPPTYEQSPPLYNNYPINQTGRQPVPLFTSIRTTPSTPHLPQSSHVPTPSIYAAMPPSYAEIFLTPHTLTN